MLILLYKIIFGGENEKIIIINIGTHVDFDSM